MCVDYAIHDTDSGNPHCHIMLTMRPLDERGAWAAKSKTECIYRHKPATFAEANEMIDRYICFYNHERIQLKTGEAPLARRLSACRKSIFAPLCGF